ncbi:hypothetical protein CN987_01950 [Bacillus thuringiensis]|nr:hypothetical protein CN987_01950 [Bacillus thuringiensis]PGX90053.1 hypothetical protein COE39_28460 [Bacillus thuringiensis]
MLYFYGRFPNTPNRTYLSLNIRLYLGFWCKNFDVYEKKWSIKLKHTDTSTLKKIVIGIEKQDPFKLKSL